MIQNVQVRCFLWELSLVYFRALSSMILSLPSIIFARRGSYRNLLQKAAQPIVPDELRGLSTLCPLNWSPLTSSPLTSAHTVLTKIETLNHITSNTRTDEALFERSDTLCDSVGLMSRRSVAGLTGNSPFRLGLTKSRLVPNIKV